MKVLEDGTVTMTFSEYDSPCGGRAGVRLPVIRNLVSIHGDCHADHGGFRA